MNLLDVVPAHWTKASVGKYCDVQLGKMLQSDPTSEKDELKRYLRAINIAKHGLDISHEFSMWIKPNEIQKFQLRRGDILVSEGGDAGRTAVFDCDEEFYFQNAINRVRPVGKTKILPNFIYYWFTFLKAAGYVEMICNVATIAHFTAEKVKAAPLALPPLETQHRIAQFLDEKTARIDGLIEKKRALLDRLTEKRQALITCAVTKGLSPDAPMKPSGIDWLGDVPAHWVCRRLRFKMQINPSKREITLSDSLSVSFVPMEAVGECGGLNLDIERELGEVNSGYTYFANNDVVIAKITPCFENGKAAIAKGLKNGVAFGTTELHVLRGNEDLLPQYLFYIATSYPFIRVGEAEMYGSGGQKRVPESFLKDFRIGIPNVDEQQEIIVFVEGVKRHLDIRVKKTIKSIELLNEYRSALITAAVTGQIEGLQ